MSGADIGQGVPLTASARTCGRCGGYVVVLPGWSVYCSTCKTTTTTTVTKEGEQGQAAVSVTVVPGLTHPFAWWSEDHILALRPCSAEDLPAVLVAASAHILSGQQAVPASADVVHWLPAGHESTAYPCCGRQGQVGDRVAVDLDGVTCPYAPPPELYENSSRTDPVAGDIIRDSTGCAWRFGQDGRWTMASVTGVVRTPEAIVKYGPLLLLWDAAAGVMPEPTS